MERLRKLLHPVGKCRIIDTVLHAAESRLGWDTILQHRSYKETAGSVGIAIYDNRVEIENPGTFPPDWDAEKMKSEHESKPQNRLLANVLYKRKVLESWGRGIGLMMSECSKAGLPEPEYKIWADNAASRCVWPAASKEMHIEKLCRLVGFDERQTETLVKGKPLEYAGKLYSEEHGRRFTTEKVRLSSVESPDGWGKLVLAIARKPIAEWFKE